jgi:hypothetical protein
MKLKLISMVLASMAYRPCQILLKPFKQSNGLVGSTHGHHIQSYIYIYITYTHIYTHSPPANWHILFDLLSRAFIFLYGRKVS